MRQTPLRKWRNEKNLLGEKNLLSPEWRKAQGRQMAEERAQGAQPKE